MDSPSQMMAIVVRPGHRLVQQLQSDGRRGRGKEAYAGHIAARPVEALDRPELDRVSADPKYDWDGRGRRLGCQCRSVVARVNQGHLPRQAPSAMKASPA